MTGARPRWWAAWSSKRVVSAGGMFCAFFGLPGTDGGSTGTPRAAPVWEMVVRWVKECRINELAVLSLDFVITALENRPKISSVSTSILGTKITRISV